MSDSLQPPELQHARPPTQAELERHEDEQVPVCEGPGEPGLTMRKEGDVARAGATGAGGAQVREDLGAA